MKEWQTRIPERVFSSRGAAGGSKGAGQAHMIPQPGHPDNRELDEAGQTTTVNAHREVSWGSISGNVQSTSSAGGGATEGLANQAVRRACGHLHHRSALHGRDHRAWLLLALGARDYARGRGVGGGECGGGFGCQLSSTTYRRRLKGEAAARIEHARIVGALVAAGAQILLFVSFIAFFFTFFLHFGAIHILCKNFFFSKCNVEKNILF